MYIEKKQHHQPEKGKPRQRVEPGIGKCKKEQHENRAHGDKKPSFKIKPFKHCLVRLPLPGYFQFLYNLLDDSRSEEHTSELQSLMRISYAVFCLKQKNKLTIISHY